MVIFDLTSPRPTPFLPSLMNNEWRKEVKICFQTSFLHSLFINEGRKGGEDKSRPETKMIKSKISLALPPEPEVTKWEGTPPLSLRLRRKGVRSKNKSKKKWRIDGFFLVSFFINITALFRSYLLFLSYIVSEGNKA